MYSFSPRRSNKIALLLTTIFLITGVVFLGTPAVFEGMAFAAISQMIGVIFFSLALCLITRFFTKSFVYSIREGDDGSLDLLVTEYQGKRGITVCRISLSGIEKAVRCTDKATKKEVDREGRARKIYSYLADISPTEYIAIFATECGEPLFIKLAYDERLFEILSSQ